MKNQALFSQKDKSKKLKYHLLQFLFGALRVKIFSTGSLENQSEPKSVIMIITVYGHSLEILI